MKYLLILVLLLPGAVSAQDMILRHASLYIDKNLIYHDSLCLDRFIQKIPKEAWRSYYDESSFMFDCFSDHDEDSFKYTGTHGSFDSSWVDSIADMIWGEVPAHDTTKEYIVEIREVCDTVPNYHLCLNCKLYDIYCHTDTIWGDKVQVWLTPWKIRVLMEFLDRPRDTLALRYYYQDNHKRR